MVDIRSRTEVERELALADLRAKLADTTEPAVRAALQTAIERLEVAAPAIPSGGPGRASIVRALDAQGLTRPEIGEGPHLTENSVRVLTHRYFMKNDKFEPVEDAPGMFRRVARAIADPDRRYGASDVEVAETEDAFYRMMTRLEFLPNSPTMMNAGTDAGTLSACFVLPLEDSMSAIMKTASDIAMVQKFGGGTGVPLSNLRQKGAHISSPPTARPAGPSPSSATSPASRR